MKKYFLKFVSALLSLLILIGLTSCSEERPSEETDMSYDTLINNGESEHSYVIVRSDNATDEEAELVSTLAEKIYQSTGYIISVNTDFEREGTQFVRGDYEILVGVTNRDESQKCERLKYKDWAITYETTRVAIYARKLESLSDAIDYFTENYLNSVEKTLKLPCGLNYSRSFDYDIKALTINGVAIDNYQIVANDKDKLLAYSLVDAIGNMCGTILPVSSTASTEKKNIIIGMATEVSASVLNEIGFDEFLIQISDNGDLIVGSNNLAYDSEYAISVLLTEFMNYNIETQSFTGGDKDMIELLTVNKKGDIMDDKLCGLINADAEYLAGIDAKSDALKSSILNSENTVNPAVFSGTIYYVSNNGNDSNDGKSPEKAWKSLEKVNSSTISRGSAVLFERGDLWRGSLITQNGVTYSSYGTGEKPRIYGSPESGVGAEKWSLLEGTDNIWVYYRDMNDVGEIVFDDGKQYACRVYFSFDIETKEYYRYNSTTEKLDIKTDLDENLKFFSMANSKFETKEEDRGDGLSYYKSGTPAVGDFECTGKLYLRCDEGNPGELFREIEFCTLAYTSYKYNYGHIITGGLNNVTIDNLCLRYGGIHGIGGGDNDGLTVKNCEIGWIGGNVHAWVLFGNQTRIYKTVALGNAVEVARSCTNYTVANNWIYQCYDTAITNQSSFNADNYRQRRVENIKYQNNLIEYISCAFEIWLSGNLPENQTPVMKNILVEGNICRFDGYGFGAKARPNKDCGAFLAGGFGGLGAKCNRAENFIIRNNIFDRSGEKIHMFDHWAGRAEWLPKMEGNTYINTYGHRFGQIGTKTEQELKLAYIDFKNMSRHLWDFTIAEFIMNQIGDKTATVAIIIE